MVGRVRGGVARRPACADVGGRSPSPASSTAWSCSTRAGAVLRPAKLWNDTESAPDAGWLRRAAPGGAAAWAAACGSVPVAAFTITKLVVAAPQRARARASRVAQVLLPHDWLTWQLTGEFVTDRGDASGTGLLVARRRRVPLGPAGDRRRATVDWTVRRADGARARSSVGAATWARRGRRGRARATTWPPRSASGCGAGDVAISLGTSGTVYAVSDAPTADPTGAVAGFADATGRFLPLVCTLNATQGHRRDRPACSASTSTSSTRSRWARRPAPAGVVAAAVPRRRAHARTGPTATGVLAGLRVGRRAASSWPAPRSRAWCAACSTASTRCRRWPGRAPADSLLVGGGARSAAYRQLLADLAGRAVTVPAELEHVAAGACVQAAAVLHQRPPEQVSAAWDLSAGTVVEPGPGASAAADVRAAYAARRDAEA